MNSFISNSERLHGTPVMLISPGQAGTVYLRAMIAGGAATVSLILVVLGLLSAVNALAPTPVTGNLSLDEKLAFVRDRSTRRSAGLVAGSSMALNNVETQSLVEGSSDGVLGVLNIGAWGMKISDTRRLLKIVEDQVQPRWIALVIGPMDFYCTSGPLFSEEHVVRFLSGDAKIERLRNFQLLYYLRNAASVRKQRATTATYESLHFDAGGAVLLDVSFPNVNRARWSTVLQPDLFDDDQYKALEGLAADCNRRGVPLIVAQAPIRAKVLTSAHRMALERHLRRVGGILKEAGAAFADLHGLSLTDDQFADYSHLNRTGAAHFSKALASRITELKPSRVTREQPRIVSFTNGS